LCFDKVFTLIDVSELVGQNHINLWSARTKDLLYYGFNTQVNLQDLYQNASDDLAKNTVEGIQKIKSLSSFRRTSVPDTPTTELYECNFNIYNCADFNTRAEAQAVIDYCGNDIHYLDGDDDGIPCESLP